MTTTVGIVGRDFVVLATDRRVTAGHYVAHKHIRKMAKIDEHIVMTMSGGVADLQYISNVLTLMAKRYRIETGKPISVRSIANYMSTILFYSRPIIYVVHSIVGGYSESEGAVMYHVDWFGTVTEERRYIVTGSGSPYAAGVLEAGYREDMALDDAVKLAVNAVLAAAAHDPGSGEGVDVLAVTPQGTREVYSARLNLTL